MDDDDGIWLGFCRRNAPRAGVGGEGADSYVNWPLTSECSWCGEYKR